jgi:hypothetical protein
MESPLCLVFALSICRTQGEANDRKRSSVVDNPNMAPVESNSSGKKRKKWTAIFYEDLSV